MKYLLTILAVISLLCLIVAVNFLVQNSNTLSSSYPMASFKDSELKIPANFGIYKKSDYKVLQKKTKLEMLGIIGRYIPVTQVDIGGDKYWCSKNIILKPNGKSWESEYIFYKDESFLPYFFGFMFIFFILALFLIGWNKGIMINSYLLFFFLWLAGISLILYFNGLYIYLNGDEQMFYKIASEWLKFERISFIPGNVGTAFFYIPFILLYSSQHISEIIIQFALFNTIFICGGTILLVLYIQKLFKNSKLAFYTVGFIAALFPIFAFVYYKGGVRDEYGIIGKTMLYLGRHNPYSVTLYNQTFLSGWNGLSDNFAVFFMVISVVVLWKMKFSLKKYFLLGLCIGFSICIRYGSITVLPAIIIYDLYSLYKNRISLKKGFLYYIFFSCGLFVGVFPQLMDNLLILGNPLGVSVSDSLYAGGGEHVVNLFSFQNIAKGYNFYFQIHYKILLLFSFILYFIKNKCLSFFFWLWMFTIFTFYSSLNFYGHSAVRYIIIIFPIIYISLGLFINDYYTKLKEVLLFGGIIILNCFFISPESPRSFTFIYLPLAWHYLVPVFSSLVSVIIAKSLHIDLKKTLFFIFFLLLLSIGLWWIPLIIFLLFPFVLIFQCVIHKAKYFLNFIFNFELKSRR